MSAIPRPRFEPETRPRVEDPQRLLLYNVSWQAYVAIGNALGDRNIRLTYDRGNLEFMTLSPEHEIYKNAFSMFVRVLARAFGLPRKTLGSTTYQREDLDRGIEPDDCYYFRQWEKIKGKKRFDLKRDPAPELAIEIVVTHSAIDRMDIYARLRVGEVWRFDGKHVTIYHLNERGEYEIAAASRHFPGIPIDQLAAVALRSDLVDDESLEEEFRAWVQKHMPSQPAPRRRSGRKKP